MAVGDDGDAVAAPGDQRGPHQRQVVDVDRRDVARSEEPVERGEPPRPDARQKVASGVDGGRRVRPRVVGREPADADAVDRLPAGTVAETEHRHRVPRRVERDRLLADADVRVRAGEEHGDGRVW
nr:hypothetical protein [Candidatus Halobonum tyrrellensis]